MLSTRVRRRILSAPIELDPYLKDLASRYETHSFLGGATQGCYLRMVQLLIEFFAERGKAPSVVRVLDWGAGRGHISYMLNAAGFEVVACDLLSGRDDCPFRQETPILEENRLDLMALEHPWQLPYGDRCFDLVVSFGVLEHVSHEAESLRELRRVLKPDGVFFFSFLPYWLSWTQRLGHLLGDYYHDRLYSVRGFKQSLDDAGFDLPSVWHGQLFPKNRIPHLNTVERIDRWMTEWTPLKFLATNLEGFALPKT